MKNCCPNCHVENNAHITSEDWCIDPECRCHNNSHIITNNFEIDKIKDSFVPTSLNEINEDSLHELFNRINLDYILFEEIIRNESEYFTDKGKKYFYIKDVAKFINEQI